jgi:hypothetical protein
MFSNDLCLYLIGVDLKMLRQVNAKSQAVQEGASAQHTIMPCADAGNVSEGIGRIGYNQYNSARCRVDYTWNDVAIDLGVLIQEPQSTFGIVTIRGAAGLFVDTGSHHHQRCVRQIGIIPIDNCRLRTKRCPVTKISRDRLGAFKGSIHEDDVSGAAANHGRKRACAANPSSTNDSYLHDQLPIRRTYLPGSEPLPTGDIGNGPR